MAENQNETRKNLRRLQPLLLILIAVSLLYIGFSGDLYVVYILGGHLRVLSGAAFILLISLSVGWVFLRKLTVRSVQEDTECMSETPYNYLTTLLLAQGLGLVLLSTSMFFLAASQLYNQVAAFILIGLMGLIGRSFWFENFHLLRTIKIRSSASIDSLPPSFLFLVPLSLLLLSLHVSNSLLPPTSYDALEYHLGVQDAYIRHGGFHHMPYNVFSNFPMGTEILYGIGMLIGGDRIPQGIHSMLGLLTAFVVGLIAVGGFASNKERSKVFLFAIVLLVSLPLTFYSSGQANIDLSVAFFAALSILAYLRISDSIGWRKFFIIGLFSGMALATKYTSAIMVCVPVSIVILIMTQGSVSKRMKSLIIYGFGSLLTFLPWMVKNIWLQGNPVFPMFYSVLGGRWSDEAAAVFMNAVAPKVFHSTESLSELWMSFAALLGTGFGFGIGTVVVGISASVFAFGERKIRILWLFTSTSFLAWLLLSHWQDRFMLTFLPAAASLAAIGIQRQCSFWRKILTVMVLLMILVNLWLMVAVLTQRNALDYLSGHRSGLQWRAEGLPHVAAIDFLNENLDPEVHKIILVGEARTHGLQIPNQASTVFDRNLFMELTSSPDPLEDIRNLWKNGFTHVFYSGLEVTRLENSYANYGWEEAPVIRRRVEWLSPYFKEVFRIGEGEKSIVIYLIKG